MVAGNMPALPDNAGSEYLYGRNRFARGECEHVARSSRHVVGLHDPARVDSDLRERTLRAQMQDSASGQNEKPDVTRRRFVGISLATGAALLTGKSDVVFGADASTSANMATNPTLNLGGDLTVSRLGFGAMRVTGEGIWGWPSDRQNALKVLKRAVDLGVNLIDTADSYGPDVSELLIAEGLYPYPKGLVIATKGGLTRPGPGRWVPNCRPEHLKQAVEGSLKRLRLDRIDLYQLHTVDPKVPIEESVAALKQMQDAGKIRHIGLSNVDKKEIDRARKIAPVVSVQNRYNIKDRESEDVLIYCEKEKLGFLPWFPIGGGNGLKTENPLNAAAKAHGVSVIQVALAWLLERSPVMLPIPGTSSLDHLEQNVAASKLKLTPAEWQGIDNLAR
jgi:pyridoxine 4-dehydrogenase